MPYFHYLIKPNNNPANVAPNYRSLKKIIIKLLTGLTTAINYAPKYFYKNKPTIRTRYTRGFSLFNYVLICKQKEGFY